MKLYRPRRAARHIRVPAFVPVASRTRSDGWTPARQVVFLAALAQCGSVAGAAPKAGMARETAYRLRRKPGAVSFAAAWDKAAGRSDATRRKVTVAEWRSRALFGLLKPRFFKGEHVGTERKADNSALLRHLAQLDRNGRAGGWKPRKVTRFHHAFRVRFR